MKDHYVTLGVSPSASASDIKKAFRLLAIKYHPDKHHGDTKYVEIFLEIKEAYITLTDEEKRRDYDKEYFRLNTFKSTRNEEFATNKEQRAKEDSANFNYEPPDKFFNDFERTNQQTPEYNPDFTPWGDKIKGVYVLFTLPKNIGRIISGWSTLREGKKPLNKFGLFASIVKSSLTSIAIIGIVLLLIWQHWHFNLHDSEATKNLTITYVIIVLVILLFKYLVRSNEVDFKQVNFFLGINGFSLHIASGAELSVYGNLEINFNDVTDFVSSITINNLNFQYSNTQYIFIWLNKSSAEPLYKIMNQHTSKENNPDKQLYFDYWMNIEAEKLWTIYLLDNMETKLEKDGFIEFNLYSFEKGILIPYIRIGIGFITFLTFSPEITYHFNEIKRVYTKGTDLYFEHKNYERKFIFFESGDKNYIPLVNLTNRSYFYKAMEILLGYQIT
jgi:hypothetical protein